jgi:proline dehydrogenase
VSLKLTQLGLDLNEDVCFNNLMTIVGRAEKFKNMVWIDMEQSQYVDRTIALYKRVLKDHPMVGLCVQAYLYRTQRDLEELIPLSPAIRLVKGAYKEPASIAFRKKSDVDANFFALAKTLLENVKKHHVQIAVGTHDKALIQRIQREAEVFGLAITDFEFQLLYGIQTGEQERLARAGYRIRSLISYGTFWFPWYVRRLAERPANVWFVIKNVFLRA